MLKWFTALWVTGLLTFVPYSVWYLLFEATHDEYAFYIVMPLFWIFGYWGVVGPLVSAWKVHQLMHTLDHIGSGAELKKMIQSEDSREMAIEIIARENHLPKFIARRLYDKLAKKLANKEGKENLK